MEPPGSDRRSTTTDSLLGMLSLGPMSGYELRQTIETSIGNFWRESFGQIYPALRRMEAEGLITEDVQHAEGRPSRKVYQLTDAGRDRLIGWLGTPSRPQVPRNELLLKLFFGAELGAGPSLHHLQSFHKERLQLLARYRAIQAMLEREHGNTPGMPYWRLTVRYGLCETEALLRWVEDAIAEVKNLEKAQNAPPSQR